MQTRRGGGQISQTAPSRCQTLRLKQRVVVQARQVVGESDWLLSLADQHANVKGVVGWVDLRSDRVEADLARLAAHPKFVGVRHVVQEEPDADFMLGKDFQRGISKLQAHGLTYDILIYPKQLEAAIRLAEKASGKTPKQRLQMFKHSHHLCLQCQLFILIVFCDCVCNSCV